MANKIRIKQVDLEGVISASAQIDLLSASNYISFVTQLDTTLSSDAELSAVSSSISQSIHSINQTLNSGLISGSSQLTSSYDERYVLSGSITQTTWDNIDGKPSGLVSQSTDLSPLNSFTSSYFTDSSSFDTRVLTEKGRIDAILSASNANTDTFAEIVSLINSVDLDNDNAFATFYTSSNARVSSLENATGSYETKGSGILSGSVSYLDLTNIPSGIVSQSTDLSQLNLFTESIDGRVNNLENATGSYLTSLEGSISSSDQLTGSFDIRYTLSGSVQPLPNGLISGSSQLTSSYDDRYTLSSSYSADSSSFNSRFNGLITTGSNTFSGSQVFSGSMTVTSGQVIASTITNNSSSLFLQSGSNLYVQNDGVVEITGSIVLNGTTYTSLTGSGTIPNGTISGSSQLTSSFDTRYTLSGSVQPLPSGVISGSSQLTSSYDSRYSLSGSVLTSFSSSVDSRLDTLEASIISGSVNYTQVLRDSLRGVTTTDVVIISGSITTNGNPVQIMVTGDANPIGGTAWTRLQIFRDGNGIGGIVQVENSSNLNVPYCLNVIDTPSAGTYTYSMRTVSAIAGEFDFGEHNGPTLTAIELNSQTSFEGKTLISGSSQLTSSFDTRYTLSGSVQPLPDGLISGSSQLTSSYDTRYTLSGSVVSGTTPAGTVSGSSQLTSSFDSRYVQTGSFNSLTASFNSFTASAQSVTTGSNSFNGTQTITGSLIITTGSFIASQITANTASLYLTSGSNIYVQNDGIVEITGSLNVSNTTTLKGAVNIGTGSGVEGGEIQLAYAQDGSTSLVGSAIAFDIYSDKIRMFEGGGTNRGAYLNVASQSAGVGSEIVTSPNVSTIQTITSASYAALTPVSGTLYIIIG